MAVDFSKKSMIFVTGASRGIGRAISIQISRIVHPKSIFVLIASSSKGLEETKSKILEVNSALTVVLYPLDLSSPSVHEYEKIFDKALKESDAAELDNSIFVHNAATVGVLGRCQDLTDASVWKKYYDLNVTSAFILNGIFVKRMNKIAKKLVVINISSKASSTPTPTMSMYSSGKAAREMFFKVFALEEPDIVVLNYSPGAVATDMLTYVAENLPDPRTKEVFKQISQTMVVQPEQTADELLKILQKGDFNSGDSVDFGLPNIGKTWHS